MCRCATRRSGRIRNQIALSSVRCRTVNYSRSAHYQAQTWGSRSPRSSVAHLQPCGYIGVMGRSSRMTRTYDRRSTRARRPISFPATRKPYTRSQFRRISQTRVPFATIYSRSDIIQGAPFGLNCAECPRKIDGVSPCDEWGNPSTGYRFEGDRILNKDWDHCPARALKDPHLILAVNYHRANQVAPLAGWPDSYAAWLERLIVEIDGAVHVRRAEGVTSG